MLGGKVTGVERDNKGGNDGDSWGGFGNTSLSDTGSVLTVVIAGFLVLAFLAFLLTTKGGGLSWIFCIAIAFCERLRVRSPIVARISSLGSGGGSKRGAAGGGKTASLRVSAEIRKCTGRYLKSEGLICDLYCEVKECRMWWSCYFKLTLKETRSELIRSTSWEVQHSYSDNRTGREDDWDSIMKRGVLTPRHSKVNVVTYSSTPWISTGKSESVPSGRPYTIYLWWQIWR